MPNNLILILSIIVLILLISIFIFVLKISASTKDKIDENKIQKTITNEIKDILMNNQILNNQNLYKVGNSITKEVSDFKNEIGDKLLDGTSKQNELMRNISKDQQDAIKNLTFEISKQLEEIRNSNEKKLNDINAEISNKLDKSLNERLDSAFGKMGDSLASLQKTLGELNSLQQGVDSLNKTISNVKTRGIWGEVQLQSILENTLAPNQYECNIITKKNSNDRVEFAIKIPSKDNDNEFVYLPIDSKFPADLYNKLVDAEDKYKAIEAQKELINRIKEEARKIKEKYIETPYTTNFAIMFLPTESLYSEVLRINGLAEECQNKHQIIIAGPTTLMALLNSLRVGFSNLTLSKKTKEVVKILQAIKTQYSKLNELVDITQKRLDGAIKATDDLKKRTDMINKKMNSIETIEIDESEKLLEIE